MAEISFTDKNKIAEIINTSNRLKYIILFTYKISLEDIISVRVDGDNFEVDVNTETEMFRFKTKGLDSVIMKDVETGILQLTFDPALAQGIYNIVDEYL
ncbi:hypothetical protein [Trichormus sp. NMC-1]|uniref:hypothetical protein n=1 Tax=Trichormus sp. NMC-1 TaxID=1853259 RepID=UPI0008DBF124|nr:hypothetical protein [Trichormus sp. NMC-1]